jgi:hypothetical protein
VGWLRSRKPSHQTDGLFSYLGYLNIYIILTGYKNHKLCSAVIQVRIFTAANVRNELVESLRDYIQASVGISDRGKLLIPKLLQGYAKGAVEDSLFTDWICHHLSPDQVAAIRDSSSSQRKQRLLGARSFTVVAFDSKFRYLFLPDSSSSSHKPQPK